MNSIPTSNGVKAKLRNSINSSNDAKLAKIVQMQELTGIFISLSSIL
jgi:hypothetical protein